MVNTDDDVDVAPQPQQTADAAATPGAVPAPAPPPGPSAFSDSQAAFNNPFANTPMPAAPDYNRAIENKRAVTDAEIRAVQGQTGRMAADNQRLGAAAEAKNAQIQSFDPNQLGTWNAQAKQEQYSTKPMEAFGSFAMVAALGMAAFTRAPLTASLNAMAGVMNGMKEGNDQAYDRDYAAWKENNNVLLKRFDVMKSQLSSDMELWKTKGEMGKVDLSNTLVKFGLWKDKALLDAGLDDVIAQKWAGTITAMKGLADASTAIEDQNAIKQAVKAEDSSRVRNGLPPMTPQEVLEFKADIGTARTPEQRALEKVWKDYLNSPEGLKASPEDKAEFYNNLKYNQKVGRGNSTVDQLYKQRVEEETAANGGKAPSAERLTEILHEVKYKGESAAAERKNDLYQKAKDEAIARNGGVPLNAAQEKQIQNDVDRKGLTANARDSLAGNITHAQKSEEIIDKLESMMAKNNMIVGLGGKARAPFETIGNITHLWNATERAQFDQYLNVLRQWEPRLLTESHGRPLAGEERKVAAIVPGLEAGATVQNTVDRLRNLKGLMQQLRADWTRRYEGTWTPPPAGPTTPTGSGKPLWQTGIPVQ